jgi:membrane-associated phospholipid phosphatase
VRAQRTAHAMLFGVVPLVSVGGLMALSVRQGSRHDSVVDAMVMFESFLLTANVTLLTKFTTARRRPLVKAGSDAQRDVLTGPQEDNISFFSGHTSTTFALAVAAGATASFRGYKYAPVLWGVGVPLAAFTGYLSIAADRHYFTDVLTGALVGSAIGVLVPWLHRRGADERVPSVSAAPGTIMFSWVH